MRHLPLIVCLLSFGVLAGDCFSNINLTHSIVQFIKHQNVPTKVNCLLSCWTLYEINSLRRALSNYGIPSGIIPPVYNKTDTSKASELFVMDFDCYHPAELTRQEPLLQFPYRWLVLINDASAFPANLPLPLNTRVFVLQRRTPQTLASPYLIANTTSYQHNTVAAFSNGSLQAVTALYDYRHRANQRGLVVNSTGVLILPRSFHHLLDWRHLDEDSVTKHNYLLLLHLMDVLNVTLNITWRCCWGTKAANSTRYNHMMGDLQTGAADIGATVSFITKDRWAFLDYVANPVPTSAVFILKAPPLSAVNNILTMSFEGAVWRALAALVAVIVGVMVVAVRLEWRFLRPPAEDEKVLRGGALDVVQFQIGVVCQQGIEAEPRSVTARMITFFALLSSLFFYTSYSACIVALLQSSSTSITTLEHLLHTNIKLGVDNTPYAKFFFSNQKGETKQAIYKEKVIPSGKPENFFTPAVGVQKVRSEFFAYHSERNSIYKEMSRTFLEHEKCGLVEIKYLSENHPYLVVRKRSPYKEVVTMAYARFKELGLTMRMYKKVYSEKPKCTGSGGSFRSVGIDDAYFAVMTYAIGVLVAIVIYIVERMLSVAKMHERRRKTL